MTMDDMQRQVYPVMESFYSVQGEGFFAGTPAFFIRLGGCDVGCVWCDVKESWDAEAHAKQSVEELTAKTKASGAPICIVTGGEPLMYDLTPLTRSMREAGIRVHLETSGAHALSGQWDWITFSPKKFKDPMAGFHAFANELKTVVYHRTDIDWSVKHASLVSEDCLLYMQPEWSKREIIQPLIFDFVKKNPRWRISLQTHKYLGVD